MLTQQHPHYQLTRILIRRHQTQIVADQTRLTIDNDTSTQVHNYFEADPHLETHDLALEETAGCLAKDTPRERYGEAGL